MSPVLSPEISETSPQAPPGDHGEGPHEADKEAAPTDPLVQAVAAMFQTLTPEQRAALAQVLNPGDKTG